VLAFEIQLCYFMLKHILVQFSHNATFAAAAACVFAGF
jgi:hypothetical protein